MFRIAQSSYRYKKKRNCFILLYLYVLYTYIYISYTCIYILYLCIFLKMLFRNIHFLEETNKQKTPHCFLLCKHSKPEWDCRSNVAQKKKHLYYITLIFSICSTKWITKSLRLEETSGVHLTQPHNHWKKGWDLLLQTSGATDTILTSYFRPCQVWQCPHGSHWFSQERTYSLTVTQHDLWLKPLRTWEVPWTNGYKILKQASSEERFSDLR